MSQTLSFLQVGFIFFECNFLRHNFGLIYDHDVFLTYHVTDPCIQEHLHYTCTHIYSQLGRVQLQLEESATVQRQRGSLEGSDALIQMFIQDELTRDQAIVDFPFTAVILVHECVLSFLGFFSFLCVRFPFLGKVDVQRGRAGCVALPAGRTGNLTKHFHERKPD